MCKVLLIVSGIVLIILAGCGTPPTPEPTVIPEATDPIILAETSGDNPIQKEQSYDPGVFPLQFG